MAKKKSSGLDDYFNIVDKLTEDYSGKETIRYLSTGSILLDELLGGGLPVGKFTEFHGDAGVGKSTFALQLGANIARNYGIPVLYHDYEKGMNENYVTATQSEDMIKSKMLSIIRPKTFNDFEDIFDATKNADPPLIHIVDSISAMLRSKFDEERVEDVVVGKDSLTQTKLVKKYHEVCSARGVTVLWINQMRANIDFSPNPNAPKLKPSGGKAYDHFLDIRVAFARRKALRDSDRNFIGQVDVAECIKNKLRISQQRYEIPFLYGYGISTILSIRELMKDAKYLKAGRSNKINLPGQEEITIANREELDVWMVENQKVIIEALRSEGHLKYA